jgi:hypothetical protein
MAAATWLVTVCDSILSVNINCIDTTYSEVNEEFNSVNKQDNRDDILELDRDLEELCKLRYIAARPQVRKVMNDLITKLTHEVRMMKNNQENLKVSRPRWSEIVAGTKIRNRDVIYNTTHSLPTINNMQISKTQLNLNTTNTHESRNQTSTARPTTLEILKRKAKSKHKIMLIGDSHVRGYARKLREKLEEQYEVIGYVIPGAGAAVLIKIAQHEISELTKQDTLIYRGGANDIAKNNTSKGIKCIHHYLLKNQHTNIICIGAPHRYDLMDSSIINEEVKIFNRKLSNIASKYGHTSVMNADLAREDFTSHGLHLRNSGKDKLLAVLIWKVKMQQYEQAAKKPISLTWKGDTLINLAEEQSTANTALQTLPLKRLWKNPTTRSSDFLWE